MKVTVEATDLARVLHNAMVFVPARSTIPYVGLWLSAVEAVAVGTDGYAAGLDSCLVKSSEIHPVARNEASLSLLSKEGVTALERASREAKKATAVLTVADGVIGFHPFAANGVESGSDTTAVAAVTTVADDSYGPDGEKWCDYLTDVRGLFEREDVTSRPEGVLLNPDYWSRFAKVKPATKEDAADVRLGNGYEPLFVKYGSTFRGLIAPVDREQYSTANGQDGLW